MVFCDGTDAFYLFILLWHHRLYAGNDAHRRRAFLQNLLHRPRLSDPHAACDATPTVKQQDSYCHFHASFDDICHHTKYFHHLQVGIHHVFSFIPDYSYAELRHEFSIVFADILDSFEDEFGLRLGLYIAYLLFYCIVGVISNVITLFGCVSLGQLYAKHRIVGAIAAYFLLQFVMMIIGYITAIPMYTRMLAGTYYDNATVFGIMSPTMNMSLLTTVLLAVAMYFVNLHMMTKKLNLE